jgi:hypothetical protein
MRQIKGDAAPPFDFWTYVEKIPIEDYHGHDGSEGAVSWVWQDPLDRFQHVLINTEDSTVFMVIVLDLGGNTVLGHRLLNLKEEYDPS